MDSDVYKSKRGRPRAEDNAFSRWLDGARITRAAAAEGLGISRAHVDRLCRNARRPSLALATRIERYTDGAVPATSWASGADPE